MSNSTHRSATTQPTSLKEVLHSLNGAGKFKAVVLASTDGLVINTVSTEYDSEVMAAIVALLRKVGVETQLQLGMAEMDEIVIRSQDGIRLVCRHVATGKENLILVVIAPLDSYYRRVTNQAIRQIRQLLA